MPYSGTAYVYNMTTGCGQAMTGNAPTVRGRVRKSCSLSALDGNGLSDDCGITWKESEVSGQCTSEDQDKSTKDSAVKEKYG